MHYELISADDFDQLPEEPEQQFIELERICRRNMTAMIDENTRSEFDSLVRMQYMTTVAAAAVELGIRDVEYPHEAEYPAAEFDSFLLRVSGVVTRIRIRSASRNKPYSVRLGTRTRARIELEVRKLRALIERSELPERKRASLLSKLDEFVVELNQSRLSFAKTMQILTAISVSVAGTTAFLAEAPAALQTILGLVGADKELEEQEAARLAPPPKALPAPEEQLHKTRRPVPSAFDIDLDNDVPF